MTKFKEGDKVVVRASGRMAIVEKAYEASFWAFDYYNNEYAVKFDDDGTTITLIEKALRWPDEIELTYSGPKCECGSFKVRSYENLHADWCPLYKK